MERILHFILMAIVLYFSINVCLALVRRKLSFSPFMYFYITVSIVLTGPLLYYLVFNGTSYRSFSFESLCCYCLINIIAYGTMWIVIEWKKVQQYLLTKWRGTKADQLCQKMELHEKWSRFAQKMPWKKINVTEMWKKLPFNTLLDKLHVNEKWSYAYMLVIMVPVFIYLIIHCKDLLLIKLLLGISEDTSRSDTTGLLPHWYTVSSLLALANSFLFFFLPKIKSSLWQFVLLITVGTLSMIDGNKAGFVYLVLFVFIYVYRFRINRYLIICGGLAGAFYFVFKTADITQIFTVVESMFRRFFVTQGACFINRIEMVAQGYDFSQSERISNDVYTFIYRLTGGSGPTIFWGDIYVNHGPFAMILAMVVSIVLLFHISQWIHKKYHNNLVVYWAFAATVFYLCMSELSFEHFLRIVLQAGNAFALVITAYRGEKATWTIDSFTRNVKWKIKTRKET